MNISIVIPCYNEEESIGPVLESLPQVYEVIVVDNNSTDKTGEIAKSKDEKVVFEKKQGYGAAYKAGFAAATGDIIATLDGDGQYPAERILDIVDDLIKNNLDFISASRFPMKQKSINATRIFGNHFLTIWANVLFGIRLHDSQSGMWIFRRSIFDRITLTSDDMPLSQELKIRVATDPTLKFKEVHIPYYPRVGESKLFPLKHGIKNFLALFELKKDLKNGKK